LASLSPKPVAIGVGYERGRLASIYPQAHDIPMSAIVTESEFRWHEAPRSVFRSDFSLAQS
jgi:5-formyltetrahydrofolate cyclo-ligase